MFERIGWIVEIVDIILCLHFLHGKKLNSKFATALLIAIDWFVMEMISQYYLELMSIAIIYIVLWVYIIVEFGSDIICTMLSLILTIILMALMQMSTSLLWVLVGIEEMSDLTIMVINIEVLAIIILLHNLWGKLFRLLLMKNILVILTVAFFFIYVVYYLIQYKINQGFPVEQFVIILIFGILICLFACFWQKEKEQRQIKELELQINNLCDASFRELIDTIRIKQHDFHNHIQTLLCQHYTIHTYNELVLEQKKYCDAIILDNRYYNLLNSKSPVISGFLYGKFMDADKKGIRITYSVKLHRIINRVPEFIAVEMIGILWDNAVEYVLSVEDNRIGIFIEETESGMNIVVQNPIRNITYDQINQFFQKGYSGKEKHTGLGLNKLLHYKDKYNLQLKVEKIVPSGEDWLKITIQITEKPLSVNSGF